jgi:transmembrane sensor
MNDKSVDVPSGQYNGCVANSAGRGLKRTMSDASKRLILAALALTMLSGSQFVGDAAKIVYVETRVGELHSLTLRDQSTITLNTDSRIKMRTDGTLLHVEVLRGEVLFAMHPNATRHLVVAAGGLEIVDTATVFDVRLIGDGRVRVTVEEGEVQLSNGRLHRMPLMHNQQAIGAERVGPVELRKGLPSAAIERQLAWREGRLAFGCERLSEVAGEFNRYNLTKVEVDPRIADEQIGGEFSPTDVTGFVELMPRVDANIRWERTRNAQGVTVLRLYPAANPTGAARAYKPCDG